MWQLKEQGIQNVLALRGDPPKGQETFTQVEGGFACALDLVKYIRREHGDFFGIAVAGYPEAHPDVISDDPEQQEKAYWKDIMYLKEKVTFVSNIDDCNLSWREYRANVGANVVAEVLNIVDKFNTYNMLHCPVHKEPKLFVCE